LLFVRIPIIIIIKTTHHYLYPKNTLIIHVFLHLSIKNTKAIRGEKQVSKTAEKRRPRKGC
jgi:hypothetical protein